ncbi:hypothetical protein [Desulfobulbus rhabdoformis]|nr:hypothetical protein [Desulfobulbus rhabdoformis]
MHEIAFKAIVADYDEQGFAWWLADELSEMQVDFDVLGEMLE